MLFGIGGTPEGVTAACALKCMGGEIQGRLWPRNDTERSARSRPATTCRVLTTNDLVQGDNCFFAATGVTDGELLRGVQATRRPRSRTQSLVMRSYSGTVRLVDAIHKISKLAGISDLDYR